MIKQELANGASLDSFSLVLVLNKVDLVEPKTRLLTLTERLCKLAPFKDVFMVSALTGDGMNDVQVRGMVCFGVEKDRAPARS